MHFFNKKVFDSFGSGPYNPPPPTGCGASECGDAVRLVEGFGPKVL